MKRYKRYAVRYTNKMFHLWDSNAELDYTPNVEEAHMALTHRAAEEIADMIRRQTGRKCEIVEVESVYFYIENLGELLR